MPEQAMIRTGLAGLLQGYSVAELGFDPMMVPSWITVELSARSLREKTTPNGILMPLGEILAGLTDSSFRNVLNNAQQDFLLKIDPSSVGISSGTGEATREAAQGFAAPSPSQPQPPAPQEAGFFAAAPQSAAPSQSTPPASGPGSSFRIDPATPGAQGMPQMPAMPAFPSAPPAAVSSPSGPPTFKVEPPPGFKPPSNDFTPPGEDKPHLGSPFETPQSPSSDGPKAFDPFAAPTPGQQDEPEPVKPQSSGPTSFFKPSAPASSEGFSSADLLGQSRPPKSDWPSENQPAASPSEPAWGAPGQPDSPRPQKAPSSRPSPSLGLAAHDTHSDQLLLRALLGSNESNLSPETIVCLTAELDGVSACVCVRDGKAVATHSRPDDSAALDFKNQAADLANHVRSLVPIIGIDGAETFTLGARNRTLTFCFPGDLVVGVLHPSEPTLALRDKITLFARELDRALG